MSTDGIIAKITRVVHLGFPLSAEQRVERGPELGAHGVVDEEVAGGADSTGQQCQSDNEREHVGVATTQSKIRD